VTPKRIILLVLALLVAFIAVLFTIQNGARLSGLSLSLGLSGAAFQLAEPVPVPWLMWSSFAAGLLLGGGWGVWQRFSSAQKVSALQSKLARASASTGKSDPWKS
jgi:hypothetical protein